MRATVQVKTMQAIVQDSYGSPDVLALEHVDNGAAAAWGPSLCRSPECSAPK